MPQPRDKASDFDPWQLAALARLRSLRDLDLELLRTPEVTGRNAEPRRCDLLDAVVAPPSPELDRAPIWFIAMARASCASGDKAPSDIAVLTKRLTISSDGSTACRGRGCCEVLMRISSRSD